MTTTELAAALREGRLPHSTLITGSTPEGRLDAARLIARAAVCSGERPLCGTCRDCRKAAAGIHPDIAVAERDPGKKEYSVDQIRRLRSAALVVPNEAARSAFLLTEADALGAPGQNALLKILEEPPSHAVFVLLAENTERLLPTVRSRCALVRLTPEDAEDAGGVPELVRAFRDGDSRGLLEETARLEKADRAALTEYLARARRGALAASGTLTSGAFRRLTDALDAADRYLAVNVNAGHVAGLLLAALLPGWETRPIR